MKIIKALIGLILIVVYHLPKMIFLALQMSYAKVFNKQANLTADPKEHVKRAKQLLKREKNSLILYAALEIRFAVERMITNQLILDDKVSKNTLKKYDPVKKKKAMIKSDPDSDFDHKIYFLNKETGERIEWGVYKSIKIESVKEIKTKTDDLLHPKIGLNLGIPNDPWYLKNINFLNNSVDFLLEYLNQNDSYFFYKDLESFELVRE